MSTAEALPLVLQMCDGLAAAHAEGVVHRDFKSSNVLLVQRRGTSAESSSTRAVITDFGIARPLESTGEAGLTGGAGMIGTPEYMAPEQVTGGAITPSTDLFALGVVLYEMVTGELPFTGETPLATAAKRIQEAPRPPHTVLPQLDRRWSEVILRCLARDPDRRFRSAGEVRAALLAQPRHPIRRAGLIAAGVLAIGAIVVGTSAYVRREARVRWARDVAMPKLGDLVELNKYPEAMELAEQVQEVLPDDPKLKKLLPEMSRLFTVETTPPGATVEVKPYAAPETAWRRLGVSPLKPFRLPIGLHLWRVTRAGVRARAPCLPVAVRRARGDLAGPPRSRGRHPAGDGPHPGRQRGPRDPRPRPSQGGRARRLPDRPHRGDQPSVQALRRRGRLPAARAVEGAVRPCGEDAELGRGDRAAPRPDRPAGSRDLGSGRLSGWTGRPPRHRGELVRGGGVCRLRRQGASHTRTSGATPPGRT